MTADDITLEPPGPTWARLVDAVDPEARVGAHALAAWRDIVARELGLAPATRRIGVGHESIVWHPGILAKYIAVDAAAKTFGWTPLHVIVDQEPPAFGTVEAPVRRADDAPAVYEVRTTRPRGDMVTGRHPAFTPEPLPADQPWATPDVASGLRRIHDALGAHADAPSAAWQVWRATSDLMRPWVDPMPAVAATRLMRTSFATTLLDLMLDDPERCATTYNDAARAHPAAGLRPLLIRPDRVELPLWRLRPDGTRLRAYDSDVETVRDDDEEPTTFPPRALMMTAILRLVVCDLFVHGRGGSVYDDAMLAWIRAWLGVDAAPHVLVTATRRLDLGPPDAGPTLDEAIGAYRRRRHDPSLTGGDAPSAAKRRYLDAIEASARGSEARASAFRAMHDWLDASRRADEAAMAELRSSVDRARRMQASRAVRERRTWAFPLYPDGVLDTLRADLGASWSSST